MGKTKHRLKGSKGKRWMKGQSSSSNPSISKHREAAKSRFFQVNLGISNLTTDAVRKHDASIFDDKKKAESMDLEEDAQSVDASTFKTFDTFASDWSACSNQSFGKLIKNFSSNSAIHKEMLAILAAVTEVIKEQGGNESNTDYFGALMTTLSDVDLEETSVAAVLNLLGMGIKGVAHEVLQSRFSQCSKIFLDVLAKYVDVENNTIMKGLFGCLSVLLRSQEMAVWKEPSTKNVLESILVFTIHSKPKVRKAAQHAVTAILKASLVMNGENPPSHHPAAATVSEFCVRQMEKHGGGTTTLHVLGFLRDILATFPRNHVKKTCETILKVMTLGNVLINSCSLQALHGLFVSRPPSTVLPPELNAKLIAALYDYQPSAVDSQPTQAWLAVMQEAFINLNKQDPTLSVTNVPHLFILLTTLWLSGKHDVLGATTLTMRALIEDIVGPASGQPQYKASVSKVIITVQAGLGYQYHAAWTHVLHVLGVLFKECGIHCVDVLTPCLQSLAELRDSHQFSFTNELDFTVGQAVRSLGPDVVFKAIPLQLLGHKDSAQEFKRSWILPVFKENIQKATIKCFVEQFMPLAVTCKNQAAKFSADNNQIKALSYDLLQSQLWALLPSFCSQPSDIALSFAVIAKPLGSLLSNQKDMRLSVMSALRKLVTFARDNKHTNDIAELAKFAKNYLPILFNLYTSPAKGSDAEGIKLATLETIKVYLTITDDKLRTDLFERAINKLDSLGKEEQSVRDSVLDLLRTLAVYQPLKMIQNLYSRTVAHLKETVDHKEQKKYYRILEELCSSDTRGCKQFLDKHLIDIQTLLLDSLSTSASSSKGPRLRCLLLLLNHSRTATRDLITAVTPEAVLCCRDINTRCRQTAYELICKMSDKMADMNELEDYVEMVMAGLTGSQQLASASILALAAIAYQHKDTISIDLVQTMLGHICLMCSSLSHEVVSSALSFIKCFLTSVEKDIVTSSVPQIIKALLSLTSRCQSLLRMKTKNIFHRLVRSFGANKVLEQVPTDNKIIRSTLRNIRKIENRKRSKQPKKESEDEPSLFSVKKKPKSIDEILAESDSEMDDDMSEEKVKRGNDKVWLREEAEDIVDFTHTSTTKKLTATKPTKRNFTHGDIDEETAIKKKAPSAFKTAPDGRMIISDDRYSDEPEKRKFIPGPSGSDDEEDEEIVKKDDTQKTAGSSTSKYTRGGVGIHRPIVVPKKKAKFQKEKGQLDPYAYIPLKREALNKRKRIKAIGQLKTILKGTSKKSKNKKKNIKK